MRILMLGPIPPHPAGGPISRLQLAKAFARASHAVCVLTPVTAETLDQGQQMAAAHPELRIVHYLMSRFDRELFRPTPPEFIQEERRQIAPLFSMLVSDFAPDLVVAGRETSARYAAPLAGEHCLPSVLLVRGSPTDYIIAGRFPQQEAECMLQDFRRMNRITAVSRYLADGLRGLGFENATHIRNAVDTEQFQPGAPSAELRRELKIPPEPTLVLVAAGIHARKRPEDVVRSAEIALRTNPDLVYVMAGSGALRDDIERMVEEKGLAGQFRFLGEVEHGRMPELYRTADIVLMASESEGLSRVYLESMACGRLLLASDIPPAREVVEDGVNGLLFRMGDCEHLAERTLEAAAHAAWRHQLGERARETVRDWTVDGVVPLYLREFEAAING